MTLNLDLGISDHHALFITITDKEKKCYEPIKQHCSKKRFFSQQNVDSFFNLLGNIKWDVCDGFHPQKSFNNFLSQYKSAFEQSFRLTPLHSKEKTSKRTWVTQGIKVSSAKKIAYNF